MKLIFQLSAIIIFWNYVTSSEIFHDNCVVIQNENLHITPNNSVVRGEEMKHSDEWYKYVTWLETPAGDLTLSYKIEFWDENHWNLMSENYLDVFAEGYGELYDIAQLVRKALGLNHQRARIPGKMRVPLKLFSNGKCTSIRFRRTYYETYTYRIFLTIDDDDDNKLLTGYIVIPSTA